MGWYFSDGTRAQLISELTQSESNERRKRDVIAHDIQGNELWMVVEITSLKDGTREGWRAGQSRRHIEGCLISRMDGQWGYKPFDEACHPYYYSCPLSFLDMAPDAACPAWREGVRAYHAHGHSHAFAYRTAMDALRQGSGWKATTALVLEHPAEIKARIAQHAQ